MRQIKGANYFLLIKRSPIEGEGLFAGEDTRIMEYRGTIISDKEAKKRCAEGADAIMELGRRRNIDGKDNGNGATLVNHSRRNPTCFLLREKGRIWIVAGIEGIKAGEELTYDYGSDYYPRRRRSAK